MSGRRWFGGKTPAEAGVSLVQSLFGPLFGSSAFKPEGAARLIAARGAEPLASAPESLSPHSDSGADASWTASLERGGGLPPFLLSINMVAGSCSAMKFESRFEARAGRDCALLRPEI